MLNKVILVTGGAGYIGSHTCKQLYKSGFFPVVLDNLVYGHKSFVKWGDFVHGDITDSQKLDTIFQKYCPVAVIHFAAYAYVGESVKSPAKYYLNNVSGTLSLLEAMRRNHCDKIVFSSSCATYGVPDVLPIDEDSPQNPVNPYGRSKLMMEQILADYDAAYGMKHIALRYFNAAGADPNAEIGEDHTPETHLIPLAIEAAIGKKRAVEVYGTDYPTSDGTAIRDFIHVNDLAAAHVKALLFLENEKRSNVFNLGTGLGQSVQNVIDLVNNVSGVNTPVIYSDRRVGDPHTLVASFQKAEKILGWQPKNSDLDNIIKTAWNWHSHKNNSM